MKKLTPILLILAALAVMALPDQGFGQGPSAGASCPGPTSSTAGYTPSPKGYQQLTVSTVSVGLTVPSGTLFAVVVVQLATAADQAIRYRDDGTAPTASIGTPIGAGTLGSTTLSGVNSAFTVCGNALSAIRFIRTGATDVVLNVNYYGIP